MSTNRRVHLKFLVLVSRFSYGGTVAQPKGSEVQDCGQARSRGDYADFMSEKGEMF